MAIDGDHHAALCSLCDGHNELALEVQQEGIVSQCPRFDFQAVFIPQVAVRVEVSRSEHNVAARILQQHFDPSLPFSREPRGEIVSREQTRNVDMDVDRNVPDGRSPDEKHESPRHFSAVRISFDPRSPVPDD